MAASPGCRPQDRRWAQIRNWDTMERAERQRKAQEQAEAAAVAEKHRVWAAAHPTEAWWGEFFHTLFLKIPFYSTVAVIGAGIWLFLNFWLWLLGSLMSLLFLLIPMTLFPGAMDFWGICAMVGGVWFVAMCHGIWRSEGKG